VTRIASDYAGNNPSTNPLAPVTIDSHVLIIGRYAVIQWLAFSFVLALFNQGRSTSAEGYALVTGAKGFAAVAKPVASSMHMTHRVYGQLPLNGAWEPRCDLNGTMGAY
jgi:hypothetical protein